MRKLILLGFILALALAGCGGSDDSDSSSGSDEEQIQALVERYNAAAEEVDAAEICNEILPPSTEGSERDTDLCVKQVEPALERDPEVWSPVTDVREIEVDGDSATATATLNGRDLELIFSRQSDRWWMDILISVIASQGQS